MKTYTIKQYNPSYYTIWNSFIAEAKNATFLFHRDFMEYHKERFEDYSLLVFDAKENLRAVLPANRVGEVVYSHQGLTYGGFVFDEKIKLAEIISLVKETLEFLLSAGILSLEIKIIPAIYNNFPSDEMEYVSFLLEAKLTRRDSIAVLDIQNKIPVSRVRNRGIEKGIKNNLRIIEVANFSEFWNELLIPNLKERYNTKPVHSLEEITYLKTKFPKQIKQFNVYDNEKIVGGVTVFETENVIHPQYISGNKSFNNELGGLDFLYNYLISEVYKEDKYFDFGISNENNGKNLNDSLHYWKESFGARTIVQNFYRIETSCFTNLETVLV